MTLELHWILQTLEHYITFRFAWRLCGHCRSIGIGHLHPLDVLLADDLVLDNRPGIIFTNDTACCLLDTARGFPGLVDILGWELLQLWKVFPLKVKKTHIKLPILL